MRTILTLSTVAAPSEPHGAAEGAVVHSRQGTWRTLPLPARLYVAVVMALGAAVFVRVFPRTIEEPMVFILLGALACVTSAWKVTLPMPVANGSTLSVSYAANLMSLLLLGTGPAVLVAALGVLTQCRLRQKQPYPLHRTAFSLAMAALTMIATSAVYTWLGGPETPTNSLGLARPLVGAITTYFMVNTGLVAAAIALSTGRTLLSTWRDDFLWSGASYMVAGTAGAAAALVVRHGDPWKAILFVAPIYLTYRTYELFAGRLDDQKRHTEIVHRLHQETAAALTQAREAERALAAEKERLAFALAEMTKLEHLRNELLERERIARASAEKANQLKDQFLAIVSHELRTPLNAILGWGDMLCNRKVTDAVRERAAHGISHSAKRQARLIEDLLDVSRIASGTLRLEHSFVDLRDVIREAVQVLQPNADEKQIRVTLAIHASTGCVYGDSARLQQVASNLVSNALKFTQSGGAIRVELRSAHGDAELVVSDTGQGISPEFLPWVFEPFRQGDGSTTRIHSGLGLGLSIVKNLVEAHGGTVFAESRGEGHGATFTVRLPIANTGEWFVAADRTAAAGEALSAVEPIEGTSVLVVDDDEQSREVVAAHLEHCRATVLVAASATQALDLLERERIDVLLADIGMPDIDGYGLIRRVRSLSIAEKASVPAAALTAFAREQDREQALQAGFQMHLSKPIDERSLIIAVARLRRMPRVQRCVPPSASRTDSFSMGPRADPRPNGSARATERHSHA